MYEHALHSLKCSIQECPEPIFHKGKRLCSKHYTRWKRHGDPLVTTRASPLPEGATEKLCPRCEKTRPVAEFKKRKSGAYAGYCNSCGDSYQKEYATTDGGREARRRATTGWSTRNHEYFLKYRYGITLADYEALLASQDGRCAICQTDEPGGNFTKWAVDHCHDTNKVRGLLCTHCNMGIGQLGDDPARLRAAADYLDRHR